MTPWSSGRVIYRAAKQWSANQDLRWGAALAYYALFSTAPLFVIAINIASFVFGPEAARGEVERQLTESIGREPARAIQSLIQEAHQEQGGTWAPIIGYVVLVVGALGVFLHLRAALRFIWKLEATQGSGFIAMVVDYVLALVMVLFMGFLLLASLGISVAVTALQAFMGDRLPLSVEIWQAVEFGVSFLLLTLLFAATYWILSGHRISWGYVLYGSVLAALLFTVGKSLLSYYLVFAGTSSAYGAAGSVAVFLVWVYYSSQVLFFGAELIQARRIEMERPATPL
jgi:membrane protein